MEGLHQPQNTPLVREGGGARLQHKQRELVDEKQRALFGLVTAALAGPLALPAGPSLPVYAGNAEQDAVLATHAGEVLVGERGGLAAARDEEAQVRQGPLSLVVGRVAVRDEAAAEDAAARGGRYGLS